MSGSSLGGRDDVVLSGRQPANAPNVTRPTAPSSARRLGRRPVRTLRSGLPDTRPP